MKRFFILILALFSLLSLTIEGGAKENPWLNQHAESHYNLKHVKLYGEGEDLKYEAKSYLGSFISNLHGEKSGLRLIHKQTSLAGKHLTFIQTYDSIPVYGSSAKLNLGKDGSILSLFHKTLPTSKWKLTPFEWKDPDSVIRAETGFEGQIYVEPVVYYDTKPVYAQKVRLINHRNGTNKEVIYNEELEVLFEEDKNLYLGGPDTTVTAYVFMPDPLTTAHEEYGNPYWDNNDQNVPELNAERRKVQMRVFKPSNDTFYLTGPYVKIESFSAPTTSRTYSLNGEFDFKRANNSFEDVNAFYHISNFQRYIQSLGFNNTANYPIPVDAHAMSDQDNSQFSGNFNNNRGKLFFGEGGVDDAEDADIIIHEYSHAISAYVSPNSSSGPNETKALEEGLGDYFACSYSRALEPYRWERLFFWDAGIRDNAQNAFWSGRWCTTNQHYPDDLDGSVYNDGEIWAGTLMKIWEEAGRETTDKLMIQALHSFSSSMTMRDAARLFIQADSLLYKKKHEWTIAKHLRASGLATKEMVGNSQVVKDELDIKVYNQGGAFKVELNRDIRNIQVQLQSVNGKTLSNRQFSNVESFRLPHSHLASGVYLISLSSSGMQEVVKVVK